MNGADPQFVKNINRKEFKQINGNIKSLKYLKEKVINNSHNHLRKYRFESIMFDEANGGSGSVEYRSMHFGGFIFLLFCSLFRSTKQEEEDRTNRIKRRQHTQQTSSATVYFTVSLSAHRRCLLQVKSTQKNLTPRAIRAAMKH